MFLAKVTAEEEEEVPEYAKKLKTLQSFPQHLLKNFPPKIAY